MFYREAAIINVIVFVWTPLVLEPMIYNSRGENANYCNTESVNLSDERKRFHSILQQWRGNHHKFGITSVKIIHILKYFCFVDIRSRPTAKKWRRSVWSYCQKGRTFLCLWRRTNGVWRHRNTMQNHTKQRKNVCYRGTDVYA